MLKTLLPTIAALALAATAQAQVYITEFFYQGRGGSPGNEHEFVELTNVGDSPVDVTGWYYRDSTNNPATPFSLSGFGSIAPGESVIFTDLSEANFRTVWPDLDAGVRILGGAVPGLGNGDSIRIFDSGNSLVDRLDYNAGPDNGPRWRWVTGVTTTDNLGQNNIGGWVFSAFSPDNSPIDSPFALALVNAAGNPVTNITSINGDIGNPGVFAVAVPEPSTVWMGVAIAAAVAMRLRKRRATAVEVFYRNLAGSARGASVPRA